MPNRVALIGCGVMGGAIGTRLCEVGETLTVFDIDETRMQALAALMKYFEGPGMEGIPT